MAADKSAPAPPPGPAVDARGVPAVDPTANVILILEAAMRREDDLREMSSNHLEKVTSLRAAHNHEIMGLRADYDEKLRMAESDRINAIRAVDVGAVNRAAEVSATQATTLAAQVATSAETLRTQVAAAATAAAVSLTAALVPIQEAIADLRRAQYEAQGQKTQVVERRANSGAIYAAIGLGVTLLLAVISVAAFVIANR